MKAKRKRIRKIAQYKDNIKPIIGIGATYSIGSDCYPYTIVSINKSGKTIGLTGDLYEANKNGAIPFDYYANQDYVYTSVPVTKDNVSYATLRKNGYFYFKGSGSKHGAIIIGHRRHYSDPSF